MINTKELRRLLEEDGKNNIDLDEIHELLDCLEAAEKDATLKERVIDALGSELNTVANKRDVLRAKVEQMEIGKREISEAHNVAKRRLSALADENIALQAKIVEMERQEPVATVHINSITGNPSVDFIPGHRYLHHNSSLYALPGVKGEEK